MRNAPDQDEEQLIIEPITWLDGSPVRPRRRLGAPAWNDRLARPSILALGEGLALLGCFSLPWFSMNDLLLDGGPGLISQTQSFVSFVGWSIARGMPLRTGSVGLARLDLFVHLWLVPLAAGALVVISWAHARAQFSARLAAGAILALSTLSLLVELGYYVQVNSLASIMGSGPGGTATIGVEWGCWLAVGVSVVAIVAAASELRRSSAAEGSGLDEPAD